MCKNDFFNRILAVVECETEVSKADILTSKAKTRDIVDARYLLIYFLNELGLDASYIARCISMTRQGVRQILNTFDLRRKQGGKIFEITFQRIRKTIETD